jgi:hypothetical protein
VQYADTFDTLVRPNAAKFRARVEARPRPARPTGESPSQRSTGYGSMVRSGDAWLVDDITSY